MRFIAPCLALVSLAASPAFAGDSVRVTWNGEVEFNQINPAPLGTPSPGEGLSISFLLDTDDFVDSPNFPTRGYVIDQGSFEMAFESVTVGLASPFPAGATPYFVIRDNDPAVDGFFISTNVEAPEALPLEQQGVFDTFAVRTSVTYGGDALPGLDLLDALGDYDFTGLTVFGFAVTDGPFEPMGMIFESLSIELEGGAPSWTNEGCALAGAGGEPLLAGTGELVPNAPNTLSLSNAAASASAALFASVGSTPAAFKGGTLKPLPAAVLFFGTTSGSGDTGLTFRFPSGLATGTELWAQWAVMDGGAVQGVALSNAVRGVAE